jgi:hypothetical protein
MYVVGNKDIEYFLVFLRYHCHTCKMVDGVGVCTVCAKVCHKDHDLTYAKFGSFFCDCGAKDDGSCKVCRLLIHVFVHQGEHIKVFAQHIIIKKLLKYVLWILVLDKHGNFTDSVLSIYS